MLTVIESVKTEEFVEENEMERLRESLIYKEFLNLQASLKTRIMQERHEIKILLDRINTAKPKPQAIGISSSHSPSEAEKTAMIQLVKENQLLEVNIICLSFDILSIKKK